jgi:UDP-glucuronate decarboxylase
VEDLVDGMIRMMNNTDNFIGPVNLGNPDERTIKEFAELIVKKVGQGKIVYKDLPMDDPKKRQPDISLAQEKLGWSPKVKTEDGLDKAIIYFKSLIEREN